MTEKETYNNLKKFQSDHGLLLHPTLGKGKMSLESWAKLIAQIKRCPCVATRLSCPCDEALGEIEKIGHCECRLFYSKNCEERNT